jgi:hypothetical protein
VRGPSSKQILKLEWNYPIYEPKVAPVTEGSFARSAKKALTREEAFRALAGDDPRPLLVLRECKVCNGTDEALLKGGVDNEKTFLLARWFNCVKLPVDVMDDNHPFHNVFTLETPEHLFVASVDGANHSALESETSRVDLWKSMKALISAEYKGDADKSIVKIAKVIDKLDVVDQRYLALQERRDAILIKDGPKSRKLVKLKKSLAKVEADRVKLRKEVEKETVLELKRITQLKGQSGASRKGDI